MENWLSGFNSMMRSRERKITKTVCFALISVNCSLQLINFTKLNVLTNSFKNRISPNVARTWSRWLREYSVLKAIISRIIPKIMLAGSASKTPNRNESVHWVKVAAKYAPIIYREPWARLIRSMIPKIKVKPAASKNNKIPNCNPFNVCSKRRIQFTLTYFRKCDKTLENWGSGKIL